MHFNNYVGKWRLGAWDILDYTDAWQNPTMSFQVPEKTGTLHTDKQWTEEGEQGRDRK